MACYRDECLADSPTLLLPMGESSGNLASLVGSHTATAIGSPSYGQTGPVINYTAIDLPTVSDYFTVADHADLDLGDAGFTVEVWFARDEDTGAAQGILSKYPNGYAVAIQAADDKLSGGKAAVTNVVKTDAAVPTDSSWHHYVWTRAATDVDLLYVDGAEAGTETNTATLVDTATALEIGVENAGIRCGGKIAWVALYKSVLSAERIQAHYDARNTVCSFTGRSGPWRRPVTVP